MIINKITLTFIFVIQFIERDNFKFILLFIIFLSDLIQLTNIIYLNSNFH